MTDKPTMRDYKGFAGATQPGTFGHRIIPEEHVGRKHPFFGAPISTMDPAQVRAENEAYTATVRDSIAKGRRFFPQ